MDLSPVLNIIKNFSIEGLRDFNYEQIEPFFPFLMNLKNISEWEDDFFFSSISIDFDISRLEFFTNLYSIDISQIYSDLNAFKQEIQLTAKTSDGFWYVQPYEKISYQNLYNSIFKIFSIIIQADYYIRLDFYRFDIVNINFCTEILVRDISDIIGFVYPFISNIISIWNVIFVCIHLGEFGPETGFRIICACPNNIKNIIKKVIELENIYCGYNEQSFMFFSKIFQNFSCLSAFLIRNLINVSSMVRYAVYLICDKSVSENYRLISLHKFLNNKNIVSIFEDYIEISMNIHSVLENFIQNSENFDAENIEILRECLILCRHLGIFFEFSLFTKIAEILMKYRSVYEVKKSVYCLIYYSYIFDSDFVEKYFENFVFLSMSLLPKDKIVKVLSSILNDLSITDFIKLSRVISEIFNIKITLQELLSCSSRGDFSYINVIKRCLESYLKENAADLNFLPNPIYRLNFTSNCDSLENLSENLSYILADNPQRTFNWIISQIFYSVTPVHSFIIDIINKFVKFYASNESKFPSKLILDILLSNIEEIECQGINYKILEWETTKILLVYLILFSEYNGIISQDFAFLNYKSELFNPFSLKEITIKILRNRQKYSVLFPQFVFLVSHIHSHLFLPYTEQILSNELFNNFKNKFQNLRLKIGNEEDNRIDLFFDTLLKCNLENLSGYTFKFLGLIKEFDKFSYMHKKLYLYLWKRCSCAQPESVYANTIFFLILGGQPKSYRVNDLVKKFSNKPYLLFEKISIFLSDSVLFEIFLYCLRYFMSFYRVQTHRKFISSYQFSDKNGILSDLAGLFNSVVITMDHLIIQVLIYACNKLYIKDKHSCDILGICGSFIHEMFVRTPALVKLLHFNGYDPNSISWIVDYVPSMHVYNSYFQALVNEVDSNEKLVFQCLTFANVAKKYPIKQVLSNLPLFISVVKNITKTNNFKIFSSCLDSVLTISYSFSFSPFLISLVLIHIKKNINYGSQYSKKVMAVVRQIQKLCLRL